MGAPRRSQPHGGERAARDQRPQRRLSLRLVRLRPQRCKQRQNRRQLARLIRRRVRREISLEQLSRVAIRILPGTFPTVCMRIRASRRHRGVTAVAVTARRRRCSRRRGGGGERREPGAQQRICRLGNGGRAVGEPTAYQQHGLLFTAGAALPQVRVLT